MVVGLLWLSDDRLFITHPAASISSRRAGGIFPKPSTADLSNYDALFHISGLLLGAQDDGLYRVGNTCSFVVIGAMRATRCVVDFRAATVLSA